jgi:hypothetical protein
VPFLYVQPFALRAPAPPARETTLAETGDPFHGARQAGETVFDLLGVHDERGDEAERVVAGGIDEEAGNRRRDCALAS